MSLITDPPKPRRGRPPGKRKRVLSEAEQEARASLLDPDSPDCPIVQVMEREYYLKETSAPIVLQPHQKRILNAAFTPVDGKFPYRTIILSAIKKSGKTELGGGIGHSFSRLYGGNVYSIANDEDQAASRMWKRELEMLQLMKKENPQLYTQLIHPDYWEKTFKGQVIKFAEVGQANPGDHTLEYIANDYKGESGGMPALTIWDELWCYSSEVANRLWTEMQPIPTLPVSMRLVTTYAGFYGESHLLYSIYEALVNPDPHTGDPRGERVPGLEDLPVFRKGSYFCYWDEEPRMPWHTPEFMDEARNDPSLNGREQEYERIWRNRWVTGLDAFLPMSIINARMAEGDALGLVNHMAGM